MAREPVILGAASPRAVEWAAEAIVNGGVIAIPTDTVYGLAASHTIGDALDRIFLIKGRPVDRTLPILVSSIDALARVSDHFDERIARLLDELWPGPLTVALPARRGLLPHLVARDGTIGARMPNHPLALEIIEKAGGAIACTSANRSGEPPATSASMVAASVGTAVDLTIDGGQAPGGVPSTVITISGENLTVVREGALSAELLARVWAEAIDG
ncbi:MAG: L-threonylcarbamoyladenylate synthase [Thermomicrobiales bacterium]